MFQQQMFQQQPQFQGHLLQQQDSNNSINNSSNNNNSSSSTHLQNVYRSFQILEKMKEPEPTSTTSAATATFGEEAVTAVVRTVVKAPSYKVCVVSSAWGMWCLVLEVCCGACCVVSGACCVVSGDCRVLWCLALVVWCLVLMCCGVRCLLCGVMWCGVVSVACAGYSLYFLFIQISYNCSCVTA